MVVVELRQCSQEVADLLYDGKIVSSYHPLNQFSANAISKVNWGDCWFGAFQYDKIKKLLLKELGLKLTKRWYHQRTKRQEGF